MNICLFLEGEIGCKGQDDSTTQGERKSEREMDMLMLLYAPWCSVFMCTYLYVLDCLDLA